MPQTFASGVTVYVEIGLTTGSGGYGVFGTALFGTATFGPDTEWTDVSAYVRRVHTRRRFMREVSAWETGTAEVELSNYDGRFDPDNLSGPYVTAGVSQILPWRPIRIRASYGGGAIRPLFQGYILSWPESYPGMTDNIVRVSCVDTFALISRFNGFAQSAAGAGELMGARIHRILNNASYTGGRTIDTGIVTMQATTLAGNALTEVKLTADSEGGAAWCEADGAVTVAGRYGLIESTRSNTSQATFGDSTGEVPYTDITPEYDGNDLHNYIQYARAGGTVQTAADADSRALYGDQTQGNRNDLICSTDTDVLSLAQYHLAVRKDPEKRFTAITLAPAAPGRQATVFPQALDRKVRDLVTVKRRPNGRTLTRSCFISGIEHTFDSVDWRTKFELFSATAHQAFQSSRYGTAVFGTSVFSY